MTFHPYLFFGGNCREAFTRYQEIFGGELNVMSMSDAPADAGYEIPPEQADLVMHAALMFDGKILMASDAQSPDFGPVQGMYVMYSTPDKADAERVFNGLADGGTVDQPFTEVFWSPGFGVCTDRFGTPWMVNADPPEEG